MDKEKFLRVIRIILLSAGMIAIVSPCLFVVGCQDEPTTQVQDGRFTYDEALNVLEAHQDALNALTGITDAEVTADTNGSYYIRLSLASQKYINQLMDQNQLVTSLDGVPIEVNIENPPQADEIVKDNVLLRLTTDKTAYELGENVTINVYVQNLSPQAIHYEYATQKIHVGICGSDPDDHVMIGEDGQKYNAEIEIATLGILNAGESITLDTFWDQRFLDGAGERDASFGRYTLGASFMGLPGTSVGLTIWAGS